MIDIINLFNYIVSLTLANILYTFSLQPMKRKGKSGDKAWKECSKFRIISGLFTIIAIINNFLWILYPVPALDWKINQNYIIPMIIGIIFIIPCIILFIKGMADGGKESLIPSPNTKMYKGIYRHIRHPQSVGEFSLHIVFGFFVNSWFMILFALIWALFYLPIMLHIEEKDLIRRFGDIYREYKKETGLIFPKLRKKKSI